MVSEVNSNTNATSKRWHLWEIDSRFALISTPGRLSEVDLIEAFCEDSFLSQTERWEFRLQRKSFS